MSSAQRIGSAGAIVGCAVLLASCGGPDCATLSNEDERNWCYFELVERSAKNDQLDVAIPVLDKITNPMIRGAAIDKLFVAAPAGLTTEQAQSLCHKLPVEMGEACIRTWNRPHLWTE